MSDVLVLCYHAISATWAADLSVDPDRLADQLAGLIRRGYRGATFSESIARPPWPRTLAVTFDDAYRSVHRLAWPILDRLGLPATVFAPTDHIGGERPMRWPGIEGWSEGPHAAELIPMGWSELAELAEAGWEIGSHTCSHPRLTTLDQATLEHELAASRVACEQGLGLPCPSIAYPYGDVDARVVRAAAAAGYARGAALPARWHATHPLLWPRPGVYQEDGRLRFAVKTSPVVRRMRARMAR